MEKQTTSVPEPFELELFGGATERRYRQARPDVEGLPWGTIELSRYSAAELATAQLQWTTSAFQEHRTGVQCAATVRALLECKAPIDLVAQFTRFPLDEVAHVEMAARLAMEFGGAIELLHTVDDMALEPPEGLSPLMRAAHWVMRTFCVGESLSIPLLHGAWQSATEPLVKAVLGTIVRDEAAHGIVGWTFLDWAKPMLSEDDLRALGAVADDSIAAVLQLWSSVRARVGKNERPANGIGWMGDRPYLKLAERSLALRVIRPLEQRSIVVDRALLPPGVLQELDAVQAA